MTKLNKWPLLIFDLDGTLVDSAPDILAAMNQMLSRHNKNEVDLPTLVTHIGDGLVKLIHDFFPEFDLNSIQTEKKVQEFLDIYRDEHLTRLTKLYDGVFEFLNSYSGPKALVTNKNIYPTRKILKYFQLHDIGWIDVIGADSLSEKKPSPLPLLHVMQKAGYSPSDSWMIGDGRPDMKAAQSAGCKKIAVHYGYSKPEELSIFTPDYALSEFSDLTQLINKSRQE
jgi:phosphoglycolate phosphatase